MKQILLILCICIASLVQAQTPVILNDANMPFVAGQQYKPVGANMTGFVLPVAGSDQTWDYSSLVQTTSYLYTYVTPPTAEFPTATYADTGIAVSFIANTVYYTDYYYIINSSYVASLGSVNKKQEYNISAETGGAQDSCIFPAQTFSFDNPNLTMAFPATGNSEWNVDYTEKVNFQLSIAAYALNHVPCQRVSHITKKDTVIAWGTIIVPTNSGPSIPYQTLLVKRQYASADSFYMNGSPASSLLLTAFGLSQGQITKTNRYMFWRPESVYPALMVNFGSNDFTTPTSLFYDGFATPLGISEQGKTDCYSVYPNPARDFIIVAANPGSNLAIYDISGRILFQTKITGSIVNIPVDQLAAGMYFAKINDGNIILQKKFMIER
ncbi:MAG: T9SS type A sorting domain-containing protein [Bacteroidia bacterium]|nr:T9SS type A sorting domain-containing protein [Bacteroidia bacterium]